MTPRGSLSNYDFIDSFYILSVTEDEAKDVHRSLKIAAGIFKHLKVEKLSCCLFFKLPPST